MILEIFTTKMINYCTILFASLNRFFYFLKRNLNITLTAGSRAFAQWERLLPAPVDLSVVNMLLDNEPAPMQGM